MVTIGPNTTPKLWSKAQLLTSRTATEAGPQAQAIAMDPFTIALLAKLVMLAIEAAVECYKNKHKAAAEFRQPSLLGRWRLRTMARQVINDEEAHAVLAKPLFKAALELSATVQDAEFEELMTEAQITV